MDKIAVSVRLDSTLVAKIDSLAKQRNLTRSKAIALMLEKNQIIVLNEGMEIVKLLHAMSSNENSLEGVVEKLWQLLNLTTEKIQQILAE